MVRQPPTFTVAIATAGILFGLTGCAASSENAARTRWADVQHHRYQSESSQAEVIGDDTHEITSLEELLRLAESTNPGLRSSFDSWTAALEQVPQAKSLPDPRLSYAYFIESVETRVGPQRQKFGVSQTIPLFGKLSLRGEVAVSAANAAGAHFEAARRDLRFRLTELWNDHYYLSRAISVTDENVRLLTYLENVALTQYTAGKTSHSAVIRAQVELGRLEDRLRTLRDERAPVLAALNAELGRAQDARIAWPDSIATLPVALSQDELRNALLRENPQLSALSFMTEKASAASRLAGKSPIPDLTIGAEYIATDDARFPDVLDSGKDAAIAKATFNIPLWLGRYRAEKNQAKARHSAAENTKTQLQNRLLADLERAHFKYRDAERRVDLYAFTLLPKARQSLEVTEDSFTTGETGFLDLVDAQRTLLEFELAYERALADRATKRAKLEQITGIDIGNQ